MGQERRYETGFDGESTDDPGLVITEDNGVDVILEDGSRKHLNYMLDQNPVTLTAPFVGAAINAEVATLLLAAPYDGYITGAGYRPNDGFLPGTGEARTWTLEDIDGNILLSATLDDGTGGVAADEILLLDVVQDSAMVPVSDGQPLRFRSSATSSPADPGGLLIVGFLDPPIVDLGNYVIPPDPGPGTGLITPKISSFSPSHGPAGQTVTISGSNFRNAGSPGGACDVVAVSIAGVPVSHWTVNSDSQITAVAQAGGNALPISGVIEVTTQIADGTQLGGVSSQNFTIDGSGTSGGGGGGTKLLPTIALAIGEGLTESVANKLLILGAVAAVAYVTLADGTKVYPDEITLADVGSSLTKNHQVHARVQTFASPVGGKISVSSSSLAGDIILPQPIGGFRWTRVIAKWGALGIVASKLVKAVSDVSVARGKEDDAGPSDLKLAIILPHRSYYLEPLVSGGCLLHASGKGLIEAATIELQMLDGSGTKIGGKTIHSWGPGKFTKLWWDKTNIGIFKGAVGVDPLPWTVRAKASGTWWPDGSGKKGKAVPFTRPSSGFLSEQEQVTNGITPPVVAGPASDTADLFVPDTGAWSTWFK